MGEIDMSGPENLPKQGKSQKIGQFGIAAFNANHPLEWLTTGTDGDTDFGLDFQVQLVHEGLVSNLFHAQVKSSQQVDQNGRCEDLSADGKFYSVTLNVSTLNYYANIASPVLLVFADLSTDPNPRQCKTYYKWIDDELDDLLAGKQNLDHLGKESHTFRIPSENILNPDFNAQPYLAERTRQKKALRELAGIVSDRTSDPVAVITTLSQTLKFKPGAIDAISFESDNPWIDCAPGTPSALLEQSQNLLKSLNLELAEGKLREASLRESEMSLHEQAELNWQLGRLEYHKTLGSSCIPFFDKAYSQMPGIKKYRISALEIKVHFGLDDRDLCEETLKKLENETDTEFVLMRCRLLAHLSKTAEALAIVEGIQGNDAALTEIQILFMGLRFDECVTLATQKIDNPSLTQTEQLQLRIFLARSLYHLGSKYMPGEGDLVEVPTYGFADMDPEPLKNAWEHLKRSWDLGRALNYPPVCDFLVDISAILGNYFGETEDFEKFIQDYAHARPKTESALRILFQCCILKGSTKDFELFRDHFPAGLEKTIKSIIFHHIQKNKREVVKLALENIEELSASTTYAATPALSLAYQSAAELGMAPEKALIRQRLESKPNYDAFLAINECSEIMERNPLGAKQCCDRLYPIFKSGNRDQQLLAVLIFLLTPSDAASSEKVIEVATVISERRSLAIFEIRNVCLAYVTMTKWDELLSYLEKALTRFSNSTDFLFFKALALDSLGRTPEAIEVLEGISSESLDVNAAIVYVNIASRSGLTAKAKALLQGLLEKETRREKKLPLIHGLYSIEQRINPSSPNIIELVHQFSIYCDQENEDEEGQYLLMFMALGVNRLKATPEMIQTFQTRLATYTAKFPHSKSLTAVRVPVDNPQELHAIMERLTGMDEKKRAWYKSNEDRLRRGTLPIPYGLTPRFLNSVRDLVSLWERAKIDGARHREFRLTIATPSYSPRAMEIFSKVPLIDDISIFVLFDLGLLQRFFDSFSRVAISRGTLLRIQLWSQSLFSSPYFERAQHIAAIIVQNIHKISQPPFRIDSPSEFTMEELQDYKSWVSSGNGSIYSDDVLVRIFTCHDDAEKSLCTMDFIAALRQQKRLSSTEAVDCIAKLCQWNINGVSISLLDAYISLLSELSFVGDSTPIKDILVALERSPSFVSLSSYVWNPDGQDLQGAYNQISRLIALPIARSEEVVCSDNILSAIWCYWLVRVKSWDLIEPDPLLYFTKSFMLLGKVLIENLGSASSETLAAASTRMWKIFDDTLIEHYGESMTDEIFKRSRTDIALFICELDQPLQSQLYDFIKAGITNGTREYDLFTKPYNDRLIEIALTQAKNNKAP